MILIQKKKNAEGVGGGGVLLSRRVRIGGHVIRFCIDNRDDVSHLGFRHRMNGGHPFSKCKQMPLPLYTFCIGSGTINIPWQCSPWMEEM